MAPRFGAILVIAATCVLCGCFNNDGDPAPAPRKAAALEPPVDLSPDLVLKFKAESPGINPNGNVSEDEQDLPYFASAIWINDTDYEVSHVSAEFQLFGYDSDTPAWTKDFDMDVFTGQDTAYKGPMLPHTRTLGSGRILIPRKYLERARGYDVIVRGAKGYLSPRDGEQAGHWLAAAARGDLETIKAAASAKPELLKFAERTSGVTLAHAAASAGKVSVLEYLAGQGVDLKRANHNGWTPLHMAAAAGHKNVLEFLLSHGFTPDLPGKNGYRASHAAAEFGHPDCLQLLLDKGADVNAQTTFHITPLAAAIDAEELGSVNLLLTRKADLTLTENHGYTPLIQSTYKSKIDIMKAILASKPDVNAKMSQDPNLTAIEIAAAWDRPDFVKVLLAAGADPKVKDAEGKNAFQRAKGESLALLNRLKR